jgi:hypothetical protein
MQTIFFILNYPKNIHIEFLSISEVAAGKMTWFHLGKLFIHLALAKTCSPWTVWPFGVIPEQGKKFNQNSLFYSSTAKRAITLILVDLWAAQNVFLLLPYLFSHGPEWPSLLSNM